MSVQIEWETEFRVVQIELDEKELCEIINMSSVRKLRQKVELVQKK